MNSATSPSPRNVRSRRPSMKTGRDGLLERARQGDADVGVLRLARAVDDAAHDRHAQVLGARVGLAPDRHLLLEVGLDLLGHLLEERGRRAAASRTGRHLGQERAEPHRLEDLLGDLDLALARGAGVGRQRDPDRVADPLVEQDRQPGGRRDHALVAHPRLGQAEVERVVAACGEQAVDVDEVAHARDLGRQDDPVVRPSRSASASSAERSADSSIASIITSRASRGRGERRVRRPSARSGSPGRASPS